MESLDSRIKRIEQRLSSIEKFIAENMAPRKKTSDFSITLGRTSEPVEVSKDYHYDYSNEIGAAKGEKVQFHQIDSSVFNEGPKKVMNDDSLATIAGGALIAIVLFFLGKFLLDASWLSQATQVSMATVVGLSFIGAGYVLKNYNLLFTKYLPVIGLISLYVCIYGASNYYSVLPKNVALIALLGVSVLGVFLNVEFKLNVYQIISAIGGYLAPLYISYNSDLGFTNFYFLILSLLFLVGVVWLQLVPAAVIGAFLSLFICGISDYVDHDVMNKVLFTSGHFVIFTSAYVLHVVNSKEVVSKYFTYAFSFFILLFYMVQYSYLQSVGRNQVLAFCAAMILLVALAVVVIKKWSQSEKTLLTADLMFTLEIAMVTHALFYVVLPARIQSIAVIATALIFFKTLSFWGQKEAQLKRLLTYLVLLIVGVNALEVILNQFTSGNKLVLVSGAVYSVVLFYVLFFEKTLGHLQVKPKAVAGIAYMFLLATVYAATEKISGPVHMAAVGVGFILALGHFVYLFKKSQATQAE
jgi:uncharacterized membrane protein